MIRDDLGTRMKNYYETTAKTRLLRRTPVAIRIDGKAFHTFTRHFDKPFDRVLMESMQETMKRLCENIQGCVLGYTQSDEITLILIDYENLDQSAWFDYEVQKLCSVSASMTTMYFNKIFGEISVKEGKSQFAEVYDKAKEKGAMFDARCFNIPKEEVTNLIYWRQLDASRNSIQMVAHVNFSQKELEGKNTSEIQDMLMLQKGINWNNFVTDEKRGSCCIRNNEGKWFIDREIPIFKGDGRNYIEKLIYIE